MLDGKMLDGIKLVTNEEYFATDAETEFTLEQVFQQASQAWGIRREQGVMLRLARELKLAIGVAQGAQADDNKLKGLQLENGRLKKRVALLDGRAVVSLRDNDALEDKLTALRAECDNLRSE